MNPRWQHNLGYGDLRGKTPLNRFVLDRESGLYFDKYVYSEEAKIAVPAEHRTRFCLRDCNKIHISASTHRIFLEDMLGVGQTYVAIRHGTNPFIGIGMPLSMQKIKRRYEDGKQPADLNDITDLLGEMGVKMAKFVYDGRPSKITALYLWDLYYNSKASGNIVALRDCLKNPELSFKQVRCKYIYVFDTNV